MRKFIFAAGLAAVMCFGAANLQAQDVKKCDAKKEQCDKKGRQVLQERSKEERLCEEGMHKDEGRMHESNGQLLQESVRLRKERVHEEGLQERVS